MRWTCLACGRMRQAAKKPWWCDCGVDDPWVAAEEEASGAPPPVRARRATECVGRLGGTVGTGCDELDELLGGGILERSSVLVHGPRGSGKSRLVTRWASRIPCLWACAELLPEVAASILQTTGANVRAVWLYPQIEGWEREAERVGARVVVLDSISESRHPGEVLRRARAWAQATGCDRIVWCVSHVNAKGHAKGGTDTEHACDYEMQVLPGKAGSGVARVKLLKSRVGPTGVVLVPLVPGAQSSRAGERRGRSAGGPASDDAERAPGSSAPARADRGQRPPKSRQRRPRAR